MYAVRGERLVVRSHRLDGPTRDAEIIEVPNEDGSPPYRVRWSDTGHESLVFPGDDAYVEHSGHDHLLGSTEAGEPNVPGTAGPASGDLRLCQAPAVATRVMGSRRARGDSDPAAQTGRQDTSTLERLVPTQRKDG